MSPLNSHGGELHGGGVAKERGCMARALGMERVRGRAKAVSLASAGSVASPATAQQTAQQPLRSGTSIRRKLRQPGAAEAGSGDSSAGSTGLVTRAASRVNTWTVCIKGWEHQPRGGSTSPC